MKKQAIIEHLQYLSRRSGVPMSLHIQSGMPGRYYRVESDRGSRDISPLLRAKEIGLWMRGFAHALDELDRQAREQTVAAHREEVAQ